LKNALFIIINQILSILLSFGISFVFSLVFKIDKRKRNTLVGICATSSAISIPFQIIVANCANGGIFDNNKYCN